MSPVEILRQQETDAYLLWHRLRSEALAHLAAGGAVPDALLARIAGAHERARTLNGLLELVGTHPPEAQG
jgi:hypothetical protein